MGKKEGVLEPLLIWARAADCAALLDALELAQALGQGEVQKTIKDVAKQRMSIAEERNAMGLDAAVAAAEKAKEAAVRNELANTLDKVRKQLADEQRLREEDNAAHKRCL